MKVFVNLPKTPVEMEELTKRVADFHATLMLEKIKSLNVSDKSKDKILSLILEKLKEKSVREKNV